MNWLETYPGPYTKVRVSGYNFSFLDRIPEIYHIPIGRSIIYLGVPPYADILIPTRHLDDVISGILAISDVECKIICSINHDDL